MKISFISLVVFLHNSKVFGIAQNWSIFSSAMQQLVNFSFSNNLESIQLVNYDLEPKVFGEVIEKIVSNKEITKTFEIRVVRNNYWNHDIYQSGIYFFDNPNKLYEFIQKIDILCKFPKKINILNVFINHDGEDIRSLKEYALVLHNLHYLVSNSENDLELLSVFYFSPEDCDKRLTTTKVVNKFSRKTGKWENSEGFPKKFRDFNGCYIYTGVPFLQPFSYIRRWKDGTTDLDGVTVRIMRTLKTKFNFKIGVSIIYIDPLRYEFLNTGGLHLILDIRNFETAYSDKVSAIMTSPILITEWKFFVSPPELYTPFEKLFLPFDEPTWTYLVITVVIGLVVIFFFNFTKKVWREFVYGTGVATPTLNLM